mmetsp:Transcript_28238/g.63916  ORF Transcript_28238/g.63916 Transcript_28238/m.63916 type:complete len:427 (-) Transcript_28238:7817-9097(-)
MWEDPQPAVDRLPLVAASQLRTPVVRRRYLEPQLSVHVRGELEGQGAAGVDGGRMEEEAGNSAGHLDGEGYLLNALVLRANGVVEEEAWQDSCPRPLAAGDLLLDREGRRVVDGVHDNFELHLLAGVLPDVLGPVLHGPVDVVDPRDGVVAPEHLGPAVAHGELERDGTADVGVEEKVGGPVEEDRRICCEELGGVDRDNLEAVGLVALVERDGRQVDVDNRLLAQSPQQPALVHVDRSQHVELRVAVGGHDEEVEHLYGRVHAAVHGATVVLHADTDLEQPVEGWGDGQGQGLGGGSPSWGEREVGDQLGRVEGGLQSDDEHDVEGVVLSELERAAGVDLGDEAREDDLRGALLDNHLVVGDVERRTMVPRHDGEGEVAGPEVDGAVHGAVGPVIDEGHDDLRGESPAGQGGEGDKPHAGAVGEQ